MTLGLIEYRRKFCGAALCHANAEMTAGEVLELVGSLAMAEGHNLGLVRGLTTKHVAGALRQLESEGLVEVAGERKSNVRGRFDPTWRVANGRRVEIPAMPDEDDDAGSDADEAPSSGVIDYTPEQMRALLEINDVMCESVALFMRQMQALGRSARERLAEVGL